MPLFSSLSLSTGLKQPEGRNCVKSVVSVGAADGERTDRRRGPRGKQMAVRRAAPSPSPSSHPNSATLTTRRRGTAAPHGYYGTVFSDVSGLYHANATIPSSRGTLKPADPTRHVASRHCAINDALSDSVPHREKKKNTQPPWNIKYITVRRAE